MRFRRPRATLLYTSTGDWFALQIASGEIVNAFGPLPEQLATKVKAGHVTLGDLGEYWTEPRTIATEDEFQKVEGRQTAGADRR